MVDLQAEFLVLETLDLNPSPGKRSICCSSLSCFLFFILFSRQTKTQTRFLTTF